MYILCLELEKENKSMDPSCQDRRVLAGSTFEAGKGCGLGAGRLVPPTRSHLLGVTALEGGFPSYPPPLRPPPPHPHLPAPGSGGEPDENCSLFRFNIWESPAIDYPLPPGRRGTCLFLPRS